MPRHHPRRILSEYDDDHGACDPWLGCPSPPSPPPYTSTPTPSPSPSPSDWSFLTTPPVPGCAPAPSPDRQPAAGRRNQWATSSYPPLAVPAPGTDAHRRRFVTNVLIAAAALAFLSLILFGVSVAVRRRQVRRRRRRQALLAPAPAATTNDPEGGGGGGGGGVVHHVWYIRTVGLDEAAIASIAATRYRAGAPGLLGKAADCSVCLGEFADGELLRLLPKCGHAFHVPCIDTWLRAHVNCPLCRSDVIDTAATVDADPLDDPDANANAADDQLPAASDSTLDHEDEDEDNDQEAPHVAEDQHEHQPSSPEPLPLPLAMPQPPCPLPRNMRRAASMDAAMVSAAEDVAALDRLPEAPPEGEQDAATEGEQGDREKDLSTETPAPAAAGPPRFFFSRHCRARSSVLPL